MFIAGITTLLVMIWATGRMYDKLTTTKTHPTPRVRQEPTRLRQVQVRQEDDRQ